MISHFPCEHAALKPVASRQEYTISQPVSYEGVAVFSGKRIKITLHPHDKGVVFKVNDSIIPAKHSSFKEVKRTTILGNAHTTVALVEHVLSALYALQIDNVLIDVQGPELPIGDGSAEHFVALIEQAGRTPTGKEVSLYTLCEPIEFTHRGAHGTAKPAKELSFTFTMHNPLYAEFKGRSFTYTVDPKTYPSEIAPARTFCALEEIQPLVDQGYIQGGSIDCALVFEKGNVKDGQQLKVQDEPIRHKILDCIGDFSLLGVPLVGEFNIVNGGHAFNIAFVQHLITGATQ